MTTKALHNSLKEPELLLIAETERAALAELDEDQLLELHKRIRRARGKYVKQYRRGASARVAESGGRGKAAAKNKRAADLAELFEEALARVSTALAASARRSAAALKVERLEAARNAKLGIGPQVEIAEPAEVPQTAASKSAVKKSKKTPISKKKVASSKAKGSRRQAKRDSR